MANINALYFRTSNRGVTTMSKKLEQLKKHLTPLKAEQIKAGLGMPPAAELGTGQFVSAPESEFQGELDERARNYLKNKAEQEASRLLPA